MPPLPPDLPPTLEIFYSPSCAPCRLELPVLAELTTQAGLQIRITILDEETRARAELKAVSPQLEAVAQSKASDSPRAVLNAAGNANGILPYARSILTSAADEGEASIYRSSVDGGLKRCPSLQANRYALYRSLVSRGDVKDAANEGGCNHASWRRNKARPKGHPNSNMLLKPWRMVRTEGIEPSQELPPYGFSYHFDLRRRVRVRGLDYPFTIAFAVGAARLVSTPSRHRAWLGIAS